MSLILDALNRAENERKNQNAVPDLNTLHRPQEMDSSPETRRTLWWGVGVVLVLIIIIIVLVVMLRKESVAPVSVMETASAQQSVAVPLPVAVVEQPSAEPITTAPPPAVASVVETAPQITAPSADINRLYAADDAETPAATDAGVSELYAAEAAIAAASETIIDPFNAPIGNPSASTALVSVTAQEHAPPRTFDSIKNIPDFNALPWNMRQRIPTISYARHNYLANGVSSVVINNQTTGVGNIIGSGQFVVQDIFVDGVILKHGNAVFKLRALSGWINM